VEIGKKWLVVVVVMAAAAIEDFRKAADAATAPFVATDTDGARNML
jgi:hypothetical protein